MNATCQYPDDPNCDCAECRAYIQEEADAKRYAGDALYDLMDPGPPLELW